MGKLTTHVLDTMHGRPASGMRLELFRRSGDGQAIADVRTNADGRCNAPLLEGEQLAVGEYELVFYVGDYFRSLGHADEPPFLGTVPIRFAIADAGGAYHVPLLTSPWSYTTYRGS